MSLPLTPANEMALINTLVGAIAGNIVPLPGVAQLLSGTSVSTMSANAPQGGTPTNVISRSIHSGMAPVVLRANLVARVLPQPPGGTKTGGPAPAPPPPQGGAVHAIGRLRGGTTTPKTLAQLQAQSAITATATGMAEEVASAIQRNSPVVSALIKSLQLKRQQALASGQFFPDACPTGKAAPDQAYLSAAVNSGLAIVNGDSSGQMLSFINSGAFTTEDQRRGARIGFGARQQNMDPGWPAFVKPLMNADVLTGFQTVMNLK